MDRQRACSTASSSRSPARYSLYHSGSSGTTPDFVSVDDNHHTKTTSRSTSYSSLSPPVLDRSQHQDETNNNVCREPENIIGRRLGIRRYWYSVLVLVLSIILFVVGCVVTRFHSMQYVHRISVERLYFSEFWIRLGSDSSSTVATVNCRVMASLYNPAPYFTMKIHSSAGLYLSAIPISTSVEAEKNDVKRKSATTAEIKLVGKRIPLNGVAPYYYGENRTLLLTLQLHTKTKRAVFWKFVESSYRRNVSCTVYYRPWFPIPNSITGDDIICV